MATKQAPSRRKGKTSKYQLPPRPTRYAKLPQSPFWPTLIERLLLAIIDAHPIESLDDDGAPLRDKRGNLIDGRQVRLAQALKALTGYSRGSGAPSLSDFEKLMQVVHERVGEEVGVKAFAELFKDEPPLELTAFSKFVALSERNPRKQHAERTRLKRKYDSEEFGRYARSLYPFFENKEEDDMLKDIERVAKIFERWNTPINVDPKRLGMGSKTHNIRLFSVRR